MKSLLKKIFVSPNHPPAVAPLPIEGSKQLQISAEDRAALDAYPAFTEGSIGFGGKPFVFSHGPSFAHSYDEIFGDEIYRFESDTAEPYIIDCGANIGLSVLYFKQLFPKAKLLAFEPDAKIFNMLKSNIHTIRGLDDVHIYQKAVWTQNTALVFYAEGALAGSVVGDFGNKNEKITVEAVDLKPLLNNTRVDLLKLDIEGSENEVFFDIIPYLENIQNLFLEYHSIRREPQKLGAMLTAISAAGFRYHIQNAAADHAIPFVSIKTQQNLFDMQLNIFCYR